VFYNWLVSVKIYGYWHEKVEQFVVKAQNYEMADRIAEKVAFERYGFPACMYEGDIDDIDDIEDYMIATIELIEKADQWPTHTLMT
jgi:hypothetical protein